MKYCHCNSNKQTSLWSSKNPASFEQCYGRQLNCTRQEFFPALFLPPLPFVQFLHNHPGNFHRLHWRRRRRWGPESNTASSGSHPAAACHTLKRDKKDKQEVKSWQEPLLGAPWHLSTACFSENVYRALTLSAPSDRTQGHVLCICSVFPPPSHVWHT